MQERSPLFANDVTRCAAACTLSSPPRRSIWFSPPSPPYQHLALTMTYGLQESIVDLISERQRARSLSDLGEPLRALLDQSATKTGQSEVGDGGRTLENNESKKI